MYKNINLGLMSNNFIKKEFVIKKKFNVGSTDVL